MKYYSKLEEILHWGLNEFAFTEIKKTIYKIHEESVIPIYIAVFDLNRKRKYAVFIGENHEEIKKIARRYGKAYYELSAKILTNVVKYLRRRNIIPKGSTTIVYESLNTKNVSKIKRENGFEIYMVYTNNRFNGSFKKRIEEIIYGKKIVIFYVGELHLKEVAEVVLEIARRDLIPHYSKKSSYKRKL